MKSFVLVFSMVIKGVQVPCESKASPFNFCPLKTIAKVTSTEEAVLEQCREAIEKETLDHLRKMKKSVFEPLQSTDSFSTINMDVRKKYASMSAAEVVLTVLSNASTVFSPEMVKVNPSWSQIRSLPRCALMW